MKSVTSKKAATSNPVLTEKRVKKIKPLTDDRIDIEAFNLQHGYAVASSARDVSATAAQVCPQGKQAKVTRDNCRLAPPQDKNRYITSLHVTLSTQQLRVTWSDNTV